MHKMADSLPRPSADAATGAANEEPSAPAQGMPSAMPARGRRAHVPTRGYNGAWNSQADKMLQSAVMAARLCGGGDVTVGSRPAYAI